MMRISLAMTSISCLLLTSCANFTHLSRNKSLDNNEVLLIDAKQRGFTRNNNVVCAEPSPDGLSALAAQSSGNLSSPNGLTAAQAFSIAESAGSIGLRTQSIQLLRDHMYRVCELYQSSQLTPYQVAILHHRFQSNTIAILAIEQLTGTVRPPAVVLSGSAASGDIQSLQQLTAALTAQQEKVNTAAEAVASQRTNVSKAESAEAASKSALAGATDANRQALTEDYQNKVKALENAKAELSNAEKLLTANEEGLNVVRQAMTLAQATGSASSSAVLEALGSASSNNAQHISGTVEKIVLAALNQSHTKDLCLVLLSDPYVAGQDHPDESFIGKCERQAGQWLAQTSQ